MERTYAHTRACSLGRQALVKSRRSCRSSMANTPLDRRSLNKPSQVKKHLLAGSLLWTSSSSRPPARCEPQTRQRGTAIAECVTRICALSARRVPDVVTSERAHQLAGVSVFTWLPMASVGWWLASAQPNGTRCSAKRYRKAQSRASALAGVCAHARPVGTGTGSGARCSCWR